LGCLHAWRLSVSLRAWFVYIYVSGIEIFLMKLITVTHYQVHMTPMTLRRSLGQRLRSRSTSDDHRNLVNSTVAERLKGFRPKRTHFLQSWVQRSKRQTTFFRNALLWRRQSRWIFNGYTRRETHVAT